MTTAAPQAQEKMPPVKSATRQSLYWITCADGLETLLADEIQTLGAQIVSTVQGRIIIEGTLETAYRICLWSRLASRVLLPIFQHEIEQNYDVRDVAEELFEAANGFDWSLVFSPASTFAIRIHTERGIKVNPQFATLRAKDGIVDAFMDMVGRRPSIDTKQPEITISILAGVKQHTFCLDLSGDSLHRRGYRHIMTDAPLKENLAAAILRAARWHEGVFNVLLDPMCGSGTFVIEALLMYLDRAPGLNRSFGFLGWHGHQPAIWSQLRSEAEERFNTGLSKAMPKVYAFDADWDAVKATRHNLIAAGLEDLLPHVLIEERSLAEWPDFALDADSRALVVANPPYGERLGDKGSNRALYQGLGFKLQDFFTGHVAAIIAAQIEQADVLPLAQPTTTRLMNGNIPIYTRIGSIIPAVSAQLLQQWQANPVEIEGAQDFANRLQKNIVALRKQALREHVSCLRIYDADLPDFNLAVDIYGHKLHVQEYAPPKTIDPEKAKARFNLALQAIRMVLGVQREDVFIKTRAKQKGNTQYEKESTASKRFIVQEGNARFLVNLTDYLDTGLFLDHRPLRLKIAQESKHKHVLNLYSYTSTASVHAALGGAASTTSVDLSNTYLDWSKQNFALNGLTVDHPDGRHVFFESDVFEWLKEGSEQYDLIFLDPPTFSNSKKFFGTFDIQRDHVSLIKRAMNRLSTEGTLYFSNNFRKFELAEELMFLFDVQNISAQTIGFDFKRNPNIHKAWKIKFKM